MSALAKWCESLWKWETNFKFSGYKVAIAKICFFSHWRGSREWGRKNKMSIANEASCRDAMRVCHVYYIPITLLYTGVRWITSMGTWISWSLSTRISGAAGARDAARVHVREGEGEGERGRNRRMAQSPIDKLKGNEKSRRGCSSSIMFFYHCNHLNLLFVDDLVRGSWERVLYRITVAAISRIYAQLE